MYIHGGVACFQKIQMKSLETGLTEYHTQQDTLEVLHTPTAYSLGLQYASAMSDVWVYDFVTKMWLEVHPT